MRLARKTPHVIIQLPSINAILRQRSAIVNASRLQYVIFLMRPVCSDNISNKSWRISSLNKPVITQLCSTLHAGTAETILSRLRHWLAGWQGIYFYMEARPRHPSTPHSPARARPNAETPLPIKTAILYVNIVYWQSKLKSKLIHANVVWLAWVLC